MVSLVRAGSRLSLPLYVAAASIILLAGPFLTVINPGLFWDDWVWYFKSPDELLRIGRELGTWWGGYASAAVYSVPNPTLLLRLLALVCWIGAAAGTAFTLHRLNILSRQNAIFLFLLIGATHAGMVRFVNSVAFYNLYIAAFWAACSLILIGRRSWAYRAPALLLFFLAFHLNSLIALYGAVLLWLFWKTIPSAPPGWWKPANLYPVEFLFVRRYRALVVRSWFRATFPHVKTFLRREAAFILLPFVFLLIVRLTRQTSELYDSYNVIKTDVIFTSVAKAILGVFTQPFDYFVTSWSTYSDRHLPWILAGVLAIIFVLPKRDEIPRWREVFRNLVAAVALIFLGILPYYTVSKPPYMYDFYESRHVLTAIPGIALLQIAMLQCVTKLLLRFGSRTAFIARNALLALSLALSINYAVMAGHALLKDWIWQEATMSFVKKNRGKLENYGTFLFADKSSGMHINNRRLLNYEYTGMLLKVFGKQRHLGVGLAEYTEWSTGLRLLRVPYMRQRFNIREYNPRNPHIIMTLSNTKHYPYLSRTVKFAAKYWLGRLGNDDALPFVNVELSNEYREADARLKRLNRIVQALDAYKKAKGTYPLNMATAAPAASPFGPLASQTLSLSTRFSSEQWKNQLAPKYIERKSLSARCEVAQCGYVYISDGIDYKLIYNNAQDMPYARQAYPSRVDPMRLGYGYWTPQAKGW